MRSHREDRVKKRIKYREKRSRDKGNRHYFNPMDEGYIPTKPGAGHNARSGLKKPKTDPNVDYEGDFGDWEPRKESWEMDRAEALEKIKKMRKEKQERDKWRADYREKVRTRQVIEPIDQDAFIRQVFPEAVYMLRGFLLSEKTNTEKGENHNSKTLKKFLARYNEALELIEDKKPIEAIEMLAWITDIYLIDNNGEIPHKQGLHGLDLSRKLARVWAAAAAAEYCGHKVNDYVGDFQNGNHGMRRFIFNSSSAIKELGKVGTLVDLSLIAKIGMDCWEGSLEGTCKRSQDFIRISESIRLVFSKLSEADKEYFGFSSQFSEPQILRKLAELFYRLNLGELIAKHPALNQFGKGFEGNPYFEFDKREKLNRLLSEKLKQIIDFSHNQNDSSLVEFFIDGDLLKEIEKERNCESCRWGPKQLMLTEKGKDLITSLMHEIANMDIIYYGKTRTPLPESHRVTPDELKLRSPIAFKTTISKLLSD